MTDDIHIFEHGQGTSAQIEGGGALPAERWSKRVPLRPGNGESCPPAPPTGPPAWLVRAAPPRTASGRAARRTRSRTASLQAAAAGDNCGRCPPPTAGREWSRGVVR